jgi:hypothetical protein
MREPVRCVTSGAPSIIFVGTAIALPQSSRIAANQWKNAKGHAPGAAFLHALTAPEPM